jgi:hypothetical protein
MPVPLIEFERTGIIPFEGIQQFNEGGKLVREEWRSTQVNERLSAIPLSGTSREGYR